MREVFQEATTRAPVLDDEAEETHQAPVRSEREQANWILNQRLEYGWLERPVDEATLQSSYVFTRHRNALQSFLEQGEGYDMRDAFGDSGRIIADFSDVLAELDEFAVRYTSCAHAKARIGAHWERSLRTWSLSAWADV